jgi:beta-phosphoglucomutase-like phosphatase (HAD superfamily)
VLEQQPDHAEAWFFLGRAAWLQKNSREARSHFRIAIENFRRELESFDVKLAEMKSDDRTDLYRQHYYLKRQRQRSEYAREAIERLMPLKMTFQKPPLPGLRELLAKLATPVPIQ